MSSANRCAAGSNGPSRSSAAVSAARQAPIAQPTLTARPPRHGSSRSRARRGSSARRQRRREQRARGPGQRVRGALHPARVEQPRRVQRAARAGGDRREAGSASSSSSQSGLSRTVTSERAAATPALHAAPKPGLSRRSITSAPHAAAACAPPSSRPVSTTTSCGPLAEPGVERAQQHRQLRGGVVQHDDDRVGHGAPP